MRLLRNVLLTLLLGGLAAGALAWWWLQRPLPLAAATVELAIEPGTSPRAVAEQWAAAGVQVDPTLLWLWFRASGRAHQMRAGTYAIEQGTTPRQLLDRMLRGEQQMEAVRIIEGWTFAQMREALAKAPALKPTTQGKTDAEVMALLGRPGVPAEGQIGRASCRERVCYVV